MTRITLDIGHITQQEMLFKMKAAEGRPENDNGHPMTRVILDIGHITQQGVLFKKKAAEGRP